MRAVLLGVLAARGTHPTSLDGTLPLRTLGSHTRDRPGSRAPLPLPTPGLGGQPHPPRPPLPGGLLESGCMWGAPGFPGGPGGRPAHVARAFAGHPRVLAPCGWAWRRPVTSVQAQPGRGERAPWRHRPGGAIAPSLALATLPQPEGGRSWAKLREDQKPSGHSAGRGLRAPQPRHDARL